MNTEFEKYKRDIDVKLAYKGWKRKDLAKACGVSSATISDLFRYNKGSQALRNKIKEVLS